MCLPMVQKAWKVRGKDNMIVLTFFSSCSPDYINVGPLWLLVKTFINSPVQCFGCYEFGYSGEHCTTAPRCGRCSSKDSHATSECDSTPYCLHCRDGHKLSSRECPRYRLEQDVLQHANSHFGGLGAARRELSDRESVVRFLHMLPN